MDVKQEQVSSCYLQLCVRACVCQPLSAYSPHVTPTTPLRCDSNTGGALHKLLVDLTLSDLDVRAQKSSRTQMTWAGLPAATSLRKKTNGTAPLLNATISIIWSQKFSENGKEIHTPTYKMIYRTFVCRTHCLQGQKHKNFRNKRLIPLSFQTWADED